VEEQRDQTRQVEAVQYCALEMQDKGRYVHPHASLADRQLEPGSRDPVCPVKQMAGSARSYRSCLGSRLVADSRQKNLAEKPKENEVVDP
jgi:hypothetical protein